MIFPLIFLSNGEEHYARLLLQFANSISKAWAFEKSWAARNPTIGLPTC